MKKSLVLLALLFTAAFARAEDVCQLKATGQSLHIEMNGKVISEEAHDAQSAVVRGIVTAVGFYSDTGACKFQKAKCDMDIVKLADGTDGAILTVDGVRTTAKAEPIENVKQELITLITSGSESVCLFAPNDQ